MKEGKSRRLMVLVLGAGVLWACEQAPDNAEGVAPDVPGAVQETPGPEGVDPGDPPAETEPSAPPAAPEVEPEATAEGLCEDDDVDFIRPEGWTRSSHCKGEPTDYDLLFDDTVVRRMDVTVSPADYQATMDDLDEKLGGGGGRPGAGGRFGNEDPMYVPVTIGYEGQQWSYVGMRYKGNSSLHSAYRAGIMKLSFRLNFDKYEDEHPETDNQRFHGFKKMTFSNGFKDPSLMRDKLAADLFRAGGVPAARGAFVGVYLDYGEGPVYMGLYTMIEDPSDEMLEAQFGDDSGNLYKPDGDGATWSQFIEESFVKKTNEDDADWSDVIAAIDALYGDRSDGDAWRAALETVFDVRAYLRVLAINQTMVNWDTYGFMTHNYYVYADPTDEGRLTWFPWDLNEAMLVTGGGRGGTNPTSVMLDGVGSDWPMIRYLLDDPVYRAVYRDELEAFLEGGFAVDQVHALMEQYHAMIAPWVIGSEGENLPYSHLRSQQEFDDALSGGQTPLKPHVVNRHEAVLDALAVD